MCIRDRYQRRVHGYAVHPEDGGSLLGLGLGHGLAQVDLPIQWNTDLILGCVDVSVLAHLGSGQHIELHAVLFQPQGVAVHGAAPHGTEGDIGHFAVVLLLGVGFDIPLPGLDDLSAGQGAWVAALTVDGSPIGSPVWDGWCKVHGVGPLGVSDAVACGSASRWDNDLSYGAVWLAHFFKGWVSA
eukprot:TRINITY_DN1406_c0_g1_i6.p6 TRINITY_DN1406_c0_g1~~TRINITY_DN1406_c0_g1_i6.p6  ORF type:complete len:185 (+),score=20.65 TRINITY_DN1406_c0_g1_i6:206-760(+)